MDELIERLGFWIDRSGATAVLREVGGGCHPATRSELALWDALEAARVDAERYRLLRRKVCIAGGEFHILNLDPRYIAPDAAVELDAAIDRERGEGGSND